MLGNYVGRLERQQFIPRPRHEVFAFFSAVENLDTITPDFLQFHILTPRPIVMQSGLVMDYELKLFGIRCHWQSKITEFAPESHFVDDQLRGPYRRWHHVHQFQEVEGGTLVIDHVDYEMPFGPLGRLVHWLSVRRSLRQIFDYRAQKVEQIFSTAAGHATTAVVP